MSQTPARQYWPSYEKKYQKGHQTLREALQLLLIRACCEDITSWYILTLSELLPTDLQGYLQEVNYPHYYLLWVIPYPDQPKDNGLHPLGTPDTPDLSKNRDNHIQTYQYLN